MIKLSNEAKARYAKYVGADGRLIIDETVPENLREVFKYFNDNNINILEMNIDDNIELLEDESESDNFDDFNSDDIEDMNFSSDASTIVEDGNNIDLNGLDDLFG